MLHRLDTKYMKCLTRPSQAPCCGQCLRSGYPGSREMEICMQVVDREHSRDPHLWASWDTRLGRRRRWTMMQLQQEASDGPAGSCDGPLELSRPLYPCIDQLLYGAALREGCNSGQGGSLQPRVRPEDRLSCEPLHCRGIWSVLSQHLLCSLLLLRLWGRGTSKAETLIGFSSAPRVNHIKRRQMWMAW